MQGWVRITITVVALVAFVAAQLVPAALVPDVPGTDKQWHAALYFGFALLMWVVLPARPATRAAIIVTFGFCIGVAMELFQGQIPGRNPDKADAVADMVGLAAASLALLLGHATSARSAGPAVDEPLGDERP